MTIDDQPLKRFRPERPIYLNEQNTSFKTRIEVEHAIQKLRDRHWLCAYAETSRPLHLSFNNDKEFAEFKKDAKNLGITLKSPIIKDAEWQEFEAKENQIVKPEPNSTFEDPAGNVHIE